MSKNFYITTTLPYVNANLHIGHALEFIRADSVARFHTLMGDEVFLNTGTDEHGQKIYQKAEEEGRDVKEYVDYYAGLAREFVKKINLKYDNFIRTTDPHHVKAAQEFWLKAKANGDIYKKPYKILYCVGCELEKTASELNDEGRCPVHPDRNLEEIEEENYFFRWSKYQQSLLDLYKERPDFVVPDFRMREIVSFVEGGLNDFSISRLKSKMPWGVPVPDDEEHVMYVWFDALVNYISAIGWPNDTDTFSKWWPVTQYAGKDNLRQQSAMWQAMLMSAGLIPSRQIVINGFIISGGQKMSKSLGNVVDPINVINEYSTDALRYFLLREIPAFEDGDFTMERFHEKYTANLVNGLGNLVSRILAMSENAGVSSNDISLSTFKDMIVQDTEFSDYVLNFRLDRAMDLIWAKIGRLDGFIQEHEPFKKIKSDPDAAKEDLRFLIGELWNIHLMLLPFLPETAEKMKEAIIANKKPSTALFPRIDKTN